MRALRVAAYRVIATIVLCGVVAATTLARAQTAPAPPPGPVSATPKLQDFRTQRLRYPEQLTEEKLEPLVDERALEFRTNTLLTPLGFDARDFPLAQWQPLSFHIVMRYETPNDPSLYADWHHPSATESTQKLPPEYLIYQKTILDALSELTSSGDITLTPNAAQADVLVHINLAERAQASAGFTYEAMSDFVLRHPKEAAAKLKTVELLFPFSIARVTMDDAKSNAGTSLVGGEIWIEYPKRTFWQAQLAQILLDDSEVAEKAGIATRDAVMSRFRRPHTMMLQSLSDAAAGYRARYPRLIRGGLRPGENLLSLSTGALQLREGLMDAQHDPDFEIRCGEHEHAVELSARLRRLIAIWATGSRLGGIIVGPQGDYTSEFRQYPSRFFADVSLGTYQQNFDQHLDDELADLARRQLSKKRTSAGAADLRDFMQDFGNHPRLARDELAEAHKKIAMWFVHSGACLGGLRIRDLIQLSPPY